jgi:hypothetical protein
MEVLGLSGVVSRDAPGYNLINKDAVLKALEEQLELVRQAHVEACVSIPTEFNFSVAEQRRAYIRLIMRYGAILGMLQLAHRMGSISDEGYERMRREAQVFMMPVMVGG